MKKMSRLLALVMALVLALGTFTTAMAEDSTGFSMNNLTKGALEDMTDALGRYYASQFYDELMATTTEAEFNEIKSSHPIFGDWLFSYMTDEEMDNLFAHNVDLSAVNGEALTATAADGGVVVDAPAGAFPTGTAANVAAVTDEAVLNKLDTAIEAIDGIGSIIAAYDFGFEYTTLGLSNELQPCANIKLNFNVPEEDAYAVYHMKEDGNGGYTAEIVGFKIVDDGVLSVAVDSFSIYTVTRVGDTNGTRLTQNNTYTYPMVTGGDTVIFYTNNGNGNGEWRVVDTTGAISCTVDAGNTTSGNNFNARWISVTPKNAGTAILTFVNANGTQATVTINVTDPSSFFVDDQVASNGCLVPAGLNVDATAEVTYTWSRSDGQTIRSSALNTDGSVNISLDRGGVTNSRDPLTYTVIATITNENGSVTELGTASYEVLYGNEILNNSFETPRVGNGAYIYNGYPGLYWKTTAPGSGSSHITQDIEILTTNNSDTLATYFGTNTAAHGTQFVELNAEAIGTLYQDILTTPGSTLTWQFSHAARTTPPDSNNKMFIVVAATKDAQDVINATNISSLLSGLSVNNMPTSGEGYRLVKNGEVYYVWGHDAGRIANVWTNVSGSYVVPEGQYLTRLFFASDPSSSSSTCGNLIDYTSAGEHMSYAFMYYPDGELENDKTEISNGTVYTTVTPENLSSYTSQGYYVTSVTVNGYDYSGNIANGLYITEYPVADGYTKPIPQTIVVEITLKKQAITVTKLVEIDGWNNLSEDAKAALLADGYTATFGLYNGNNQVAVATANIRYSAEGQALTALVEFDKSSSGSAFTPSLNTTYTVKEESASTINGYSQDGTAVISPTSVTLTNTNRTANVNVTNKYKLSNGSLKVKKVVAGDNAPANDRFNFTVAFTKDGTAISNTLKQSLNGATATNLTLSNGQATFQLGHNDELVISEIPAGVAYTVTETAKVGYVTTKTGDTDSIVAGQTKEAVFTNTYTTGDLTISKKVFGTYAPENASFAFAVTVMDGTTQLTGYDFDGAYEGKLGTDAITLKANEFIVIHNIPINATYTVVEATDNNYTTTAKKNGTESINGNTVAGTIDADGEAAEYTNTYKLTELLITKSGTAAIDAGQSYLFTVESSKGTITIAINGDGSETITGLEIGDTVKVTEIDNWSWRYTDEDGLNHVHSIELADTGNKIEINNDRDQIYWLDGDCYAENIFGEASN